MYNAKVYIFDQHTFTISQRHSVTCDSSVTDKSTLPMENSICCFTLCILQGASEDITPKKEKPEKGNENYQKVKEVGTLALYPPLLLLCECALPRKDLSIIPCGQGCCVFVTQGLDVVLLSSSLHLWGLSSAQNDCVK